jgi:hypothetical protein
MLDMDTNMDAMSNTLLHMRHQLTDCYRQINLLNAENIRWKTLYESNNINDSTSNGTNHTTDRSEISTKIKRAHLSNRTTPNIDMKNNLYQPTSSFNEIMDVESISLNRTTPLDNGIDIIS